MEKVSNKKILLLGFTKTSLSDSTHRKWSAFLGILFLVIGLLHSLGSTEGVVERVMLPFTYILLGFFYFIAAFLGLSKKSAFSPKVEVNNQFLLLKTGMFRSALKFPWEKILKIEYGFYSLTIDSSLGTKHFTYKTSKERSVEIKQAIRAVAEQKGIIIIDG